MYRKFHFYKHTFLAEDTDSEGLLLLYKGYHYFIANKIYFK
jgi:hypothetical protein